MDKLACDFLDLKIDTEGSDKGVFEGYGSIFGNVDKGKDVCEKGCFSKTLIEHKSKNILPRMLWMHDPALPIGDWLDMKEDDRGLWVRGRLWINDGVPEADRAYKMLRGTGHKGLSIGFRPSSHRTNTKTGTRHLLETDLREVSIVGHGMNPEAFVTSIKGEPSNAGLHNLITTINDHTARMRLRLMANNLGEYTANMKGPTMADENDLNTYKAAWDAFVKTNNELVKTKADGKSVSDLEEKLSKINDKLNTFEELNQKMAREIAAHKRVPAQGDDEAKQDAAHVEHKAAFRKWFRKGDEFQAELERKL